ncbi:MAG: SDR family oxidoreductase [Acidimicrobiales bacterium]
MEIEGAVVVVTGASSGIGAATARMLGEAGSKVVLAARRMERLEALAAEIPDALPVQTDVTVESQTRALVEQSISRYGRIDALVNNAGQGLHVPIESLEPDDLRAVLELNLLAPLALMKLVLPHMRARQHGAIVNLSSATSFRVFPGLGGYASTKAALNVLSQTAGAEWAKDHIFVSVVYPSVTATEFHDRLRAGKIADGARNIPVDPPERAAAAVLFALRTGEPHVLVADPPRPIDLPQPPIAR